MRPGCSGRSASWPASATRASSVIKAVYPEPARTERRKCCQRLRCPTGRAGSSRTTGRSEIVLARRHLDTLVREAQRDRRHHRVRAAGGRLRRRAESRCSCSTAAPPRSTTACCAAPVAFGAERTMEQDPMFAFRILVDIALKALSPAINDPTTGVLALDQIHRLLRVVGRRQLRGEAIVDRTGGRGSSSGRPTGRTSSTSRAPRSGVRCRQHADRAAPARDARQSRSSTLPLARHAELMPNVAGSMWPLRRYTPFRRTASSQRFRTLRAWEGRRRCAYPVGRSGPW